MWLNKTNITLLRFMGRTLLVGDTQLRHPLGVPIAGRNAIT